MGIIDMITGQNPNQGAINAATSSANQSSAAENQLIQQGLLPIINQRLASYNNFYSPLQGGLSNEMMGLLGTSSGAFPNLAQISNDISVSPEMRDALTGVPLSGLGNEAMSYFMNPGGTLSGLGGVGGNTLAGLENPNTNLAQTTPGVESYFGNPQNTALAGLTPGAIAGLSPEAMLSGAGGFGGNTLGFFNNEMQHGLTPQSIGAALNPFDAQTQQQINSMRNSLGAALPSVGSTVNDLNLQGLQAKAGISSQLAGMNQGLQQQGAQGLFNTAQGIDSLAGNRILQQLGAGGQLDSQTASMLSMLPQLAGNLDAQTFQRLLSGQNVAGGIDAQTANMLNQGFGIGNQLSNLGLNQFGQGLNLNQNLLNELFNYGSQGENLLTGAQAGMNNLVGLYGNAASGAANNALNMANAGNAQNSNMFSGLAGLAGSLFGGH